MPHWLTDPRIGPRHIWQAAGHTDQEESGAGMRLWANKGAAANRRYAGQLDDCMKFDCQDCMRESRSAAVAELER